MQVSYYRCRHCHCVQQDIVLSRPQGAIRNCRHRMFGEHGGHPPGVPEPKDWRKPYGTGGRCESHAESRSDDYHELDAVCLIRYLSESPANDLSAWNNEGKCFSFDDRGTGYGRAEGSAMVVLKSLDEAVKDGDPIRAVIRNTGIGQDGKTNGIMVPNSAAQQQLIEKVYREAHLDPTETTAVEAHGTGTAVGD